MATFDDVGHADLLDDTWAEWGTRAIPWMRGVVSRVADFDGWSLDEVRGGPRRVRQAYRRDVARLAAAHLLACEDARRGTAARAVGPAREPRAHDADDDASSEQPVADDGLVQL